MTPWPPSGVDWYYVDSMCCIAVGDCQDVLPHLSPIDAVITDPPYGVELQAKVTKHNRLRTGDPYVDTPDHVLPPIRFVLQWLAGGTPGRGDHLARQGRVPRLAGGWGTAARCRWGL